MSNTELPEWPALHCPFSPAINPHADAIGAATYDWLERFGLIADETQAKKIRAASFEQLAARAYPMASLEGLQIASDWTTWLFLRDDACDEAGFGRTPDAMREHSATLVYTLLQGLSGQPKRGPLITALADLRDRSLALAGPLWLARFVGPVECYLEACAWEAANRRDGVVPDVETYKGMRLHTGGVLTCTALVEVTDGVHLPLLQRHSRILQRMVEVTSNVICWSNDIFSARKELRKGDFHNLVLVINHETGCGLEAAMQRAAHMHDAEVQEFLRLESMLPQDDPNLLHFVAVLKAWMRGNFDWSIDTGRYRVAPGKPPSIAPPPVLYTSPDDTSPQVAMPHYGSGKSVPPTSGC